MNVDDIVSSKIRLEFKNNGKFKILCVSDFHGGVGYDEYNTVKNFRALIESQEPDLVLMLGDIAGPGSIHISNIDELKEMLVGLTAPLTEKNIPWAHVYGNHDDNFGVTNSEAQEVYEDFPLCISKAGPSDISGTGNWCLPVYNNNNLTFLVWGMDSQRGMESFCKKYFVENDAVIEFPVAKGFDPYNRGVDFNQVMWYSQLTKAIRLKEGRTIPGLMTMHVPVFEMGMVSCFSGLFNSHGEDDGDRDCQGFNSGLVRACVEQGDIKAMCFGHNHGCNYSTDYCGIKMCYDGYLSMHASHKTNTLGGRIFEISAENPNLINTYPVLVKNVIELDKDLYDY